MIDHARQNEFWTRWCILALVTISGFAIPQVAADSNDRSDGFTRTPDPKVSSSDIRWMLLSDLQIKAPEDVPDEVWRATKTVLERQQEAMRTIQSKGGKALAAQLEKHVRTETLKIQRTGTSLTEYAKIHNVDAKSIIRSWRWKFAWNEYLRRHLTEANLRHFYDQHAARYGAKKFRIKQLVIPIGSRSLDEVKTLVSRIFENVQAKKDLETNFTKLANSLDPSDRSSKAIWVEKPGDLPTKLFVELAKQSEPGLMSPMTTSFGTHVIWVQEIVNTNLHFEALTDRSNLTRDASDALFEYLVSQGPSTTAQRLKP